MSFPFSAFFAYLWLKRHFGSWPSFLGGLTYAYLPYHLANVYVRGALGETVAATILPLSFWAIDKTAEKLEIDRNSSSDDYAGDIWPTLFTV